MRKMNSKVAMLLVGLGLVGAQGVVIHNQSQQLHAQKETIASVKQSNYSLATGQKTFKLSDQQHIKTDKFDLQFVQDDGDAWAINIVPTDKTQKIIGNQGLNAQGLEIMNVPNNQDVTTATVNTGKLQGSMADKVNYLENLDK